MTLREVIRALEPLATIEPRAPYWMAHGDQGPTYCRPCGMRRVSRHRERLDGGWSQEEDSQSLCDDCHALLEHTLTSYGIEHELGVYEDLRSLAPVASSPLDACAVLQVCYGLDLVSEEFEKKNAELIRRAVRLGERYLRAAARARRRSA